MTHVQLAHVLLQLVPPARAHSSAHIAQASHRQPPRLRNLPRAEGKKKTYFGRTGHSAAVLSWPPYASSSYLQLGFRPLSSLLLNTALNRPHSLMLLRRTLNPNPTPPRHSPSTTAALLRSVYTSTVYHARQRYPP